MIKFIHAYVKPKKGVTIAEVDAAMDAAVDWFRYSNTCWIIKTTSDPGKWLTKLRNLVDPDGSLLMFEINPRARQGWMSKTFWDWIRKASK